MTLNDEFVYNGTGDIIERLVSYHSITLESEGVARIKDAIITYDPSKYEVSVESEKCTFKNNVFANYLNFKLKEGIFSFNINIK